MGIIIILFLIATILAYLMLSYRAWEIKVLREEPSIPRSKIIPEMYFRHLEKIMLHLAKHIIQWVVLMVVKGLFIITTKTKKWIGMNWPKVYSFFSKKNGEPDPLQKPSFVRRAVLESKMKIRRIKEKVKHEHGEQNH